MTPDHDLIDAQAPPRNPFDRLVRLLASRDGTAEGLASLGGPGVLDRLFRAGLVAALRRGMVSVEEGWGPVRMLEAAIDGAAVGAVSLATVDRLRRTLERLADELREGGFWRPEDPIWWGPVPRLSPLEELWRSLDGAPGTGGRKGGAGALRLPPSEELGTTLTSADGSGWLAVPEALSEEIVSSLNRELVTAAREGVLPLTRGGVGRSDRPSAERTDRVAYLTGFEESILRTAPTVAVFVQWLLSRAADRLVGEGGRGGDDEDGPRLHAPGSVMIARYSAPCRGFVPHLDNPGGEADNSRAVTLVTYLNAPGEPCNGGEIAVWSPVGSTGPGGGPVAVRDRPEVFAAAGGTMVLFDARRVVHEVRRVQEGPDRWTAVFWLSDGPAPRGRGPEPPAPTIGEVLEAVDEIPLPEGRVVLRSLPSAAAAEGPSGGVRVQSVESSSDRASSSAETSLAVVCTTHRVGRALERWCRHHLELGAARLLVVIDDAAEVGATESARALAASLGEEGPGRPVEVWSPEEAAERRRSLAGVQPDFDELLRATAAGTATHGVAARQTLNATAALVAARAGEWGATRPGWLLHLDVDELLRTEGRDRGGRDLAEHFAAANAAGLSVLRYADHELLLPMEPDGPLRFKLNPLLAAIRLGPVGWRRMIEQLGMEQEGPRPYFRAYWNGKSAVRVAAGRAAAGVHGWFLDSEPAGGDGPAERTGGGSDRLLLGPSVLHLHLPTAGDFRDKYLAVASAESGADRPFPPSPLEERAAGLVRKLRGDGVGEAEVHRRLDELYRTALCFRPGEVELLDAAGLLFEVPVSQGVPSNSYLQAKSGSS